ncbi:MAG: D-alanyl-D-alanine carboxypeptidase/D-alanyl-D-alanine-endopeptidase [Candidatus Nanopelagicales bacterium]
MLSARRNRLVPRGLIAAAVCTAVALSGGAVYAAGDSQWSQLPAKDSVTVLEPLDFEAGIAPTSAGIQAVVAKPLAEKDLGPSVGVSVIDVGSGDEVYSRASATPIMPASTTKIITGTSVLTAYGPDHRLVTRVMRNPTGTDLTIVGAGNPLLIDGSGDRRSDYGETLNQLAIKTANAIKSGGSSSSTFRINYDDSLFTGPQEAPSWPKNYVWDLVVGKISALSSRASDDVYNSIPRDAVPTAKKFASLLKKQGIKVGGGVSKVKSTKNQELVASVTSAPMSILVGQMMELSDNTTAENLAHLAGVKLAGSGSFTGGVQAAQEVLSRLGISTAGLVLNDGSGLSRKNRITPITLAQTLKASALSENSAIWAVQSTLPVAGLTGTLVNRFALEATRPGRGVVRGKTGALSGVNSLAGLITDSSGRLLTYAFMADKVKNPDKARLAWDEAATNLSKCGC